jgi:cytochrome P450
MADDPYPVYRELRQRHPLYHNADRGFWTLSRWTDVQATARDWRRFSSREGSDIDVGADFFGPGDFIATDPPKHSRLRAVFKDMFSPRAVARLEPTIRGQIDQLLDPFLEQGGGEFVTDVASRLPLGVVLGMLGFPASEGVEVMPLMNDVLVRTPGSSEVPEQATRALHALEEWIADAAAQRRRHRGDDILSTIVGAVQAGDVLSDEVVGSCTLLLLAGWETTSVLATNSMWLLAQHPGQRARLADQPERIPEAIEEILRFESPAQQHMRVTTEDIELHGATIPAGDRVVLLWASANRDERRWPAADEFDLERQTKRNLAFGEGIHHCLGAPLARLEGRILLEQLLARTPEFEVDEAERFPGVVIRGISRLHVRCQ